jgi:hypothetical protein
VPPGTRVPPIDTRKAPGCHAVQAVPDYLTTGRHQVADVHRPRVFRE